MTPPPPDIEVGPNQLLSAGTLFGRRDRSLQRWQSEQSAVRAIDARTGEPILVVGFNDGGGMLNDSGFPLREYNKMGYSGLRDGDTEWNYWRVPIAGSLDSSDVHTANGDPWLATNLARDRIYYVNLGITDLSSGPTSLIVSVHDDIGRGFWRPAFDDSLPAISNQGSVSGILAEFGADKPTIAVSPDAREDVYLAWSCPRPSCTPARQQAVHLLRVEAGGARLVPTDVPQGDLVHNPILAVDPREPNSVFVAYQVLLSDDPDLWAIRLLKSTDRGATFPIQRDLTPAPITPRDDLDAARTNRPLRNGIFMDYFAAENGWHYLVYEDAGQVFFTRSAPSAGGDGLSWSAPERLSLAGTDAKNTPRDFQPAVAGSGSGVVVVFFEQSAFTTTTFVAARVSDDNGATWRITTVSRNDAGESLLFEPCPQVNRPDTSYFGDYIDVQPMALPGRPDDRFFATWTDSRDPAGGADSLCLEATAINAIHHHTYGALVSLP